MEIKTSPAVTTLFETKQTTLKDLGSFAGIIAAQLYAEAARLQVLPTGPITWRYLGADGKPDTVFTLEILLPINGNVESPQFQTKELPGLKCASTIHYGSWERFPEVYGKFMPEIFAQGRKTTGETRELYLNMDFTNPENNITEIQVGII